MLPVFPLWAPCGPDIAEVFFLRHAESLGNAKGIYGGWEDAALSMKGEQQAVQAGGYGRCFGMAWNGHQSETAPVGRILYRWNMVKHGETWWNWSTLHIFAPYHSGRGWIAVEAARRDHHPCVHVRVTESSQSLTGQSDRCGGKSGCRCGEKSGCWDVSKPRAWASIKLLCCENQGFDGFWPIDMQARRGLSENGVLYTQSQRIQTSFFASQCPPWWVLKPLRSRQLSWCVEPLTTRMCPRLVHGNWTLATQGSFRRFGVHSDPRKIYRKCHCGLLTFVNHEIWGAL